MKRKSRSVSSLSDTYYADENIERPKKKIRRQSSQKSSKMKERTKLYMRAYRFNLRKKKNNADRSAMTEGVTSLKNGVSSQEMYLSEFKTSNCGELHQQE